MNRCTFDSISAPSTSALPFRLVKADPKEAISAEMKAERGTRGRTRTTRREEHQPPPGAPTAVRSARATHQVRLPARTQQLQLLRVAATSRVDWETQPSESPAGRGRPARQRTTERHELLGTHADGLGLTSTALLCSSATVGHSSSFDFTATGGCCSCHRCTAGRYADASQLPVRVG